MPLPEMENHLRCQQHPGSTPLAHGPGRATAFALDLSPLRPGKKIPGPERSLQVAETEKAMAGEYDFQREAQRFR